MENRVGDNVPTVEDVDAIGTQVATVATSLRKYTISLSADERRSVPKPQSGFEETAGLIARLATKHGIVLPLLTTEGIKSDLELAERLAPLRDQLASLLQRVDDTILEARAEAYWSATAFYGSLARISATDAEFENGLKPVVEFFKKRRRVAKKAPAGQ